MPRETSENAPRGTWIDDTASDHPSDSRRSVSDPYRDPTDSIRARRKSLARELDEIDRQLDARVSVAKELASIDRQLRSASRLSRLAVAARWLSGSLSPMVVALLGCFVIGELAEQHATQHVVISHDVPGVVRLDAERFIVARSMVDRLLTSGSERTRLDPVVEKNTIVGLRVIASPGAETSDLGLFDGDVIVGVDDYDIARPNGARAAYDVVRWAPRFVLIVRRGDRVRRLSYDVVG